MVGSWGILAGAEEFVPKRLILGFVYPLRNLFIDGVRVSSYSWSSDIAPYLRRSSSSRQTTWPSPSRSRRLSCANWRNSSFQVAPALRMTSNASRPRVPSFESEGGNRDVVFDFSNLIRCS